MAFYRLFSQLYMSYVTTVISLKACFNACFHAAEMDFAHNELLSAVLAMPAELNVASKFFFGHLVKERA